MSRRTRATSPARSGRSASRSMRSFPRTKVTSSLMRVISFLAEPCVDEGLSAYCCTCVEHISDRLLVEAYEGDYDALLGGEPTDNPDGKVRVEGVGNSPKFVSAGLPDSLEGGGLLGRLGWQIGESLQEGDRGGQESAALLLDVRKPAIELLWPVDDHHLIINRKLYNVNVVATPGRVASSCGTVPIPPSRCACSSKRPCKRWEIRASDLL